MDEDKAAAPHGRVWGSWATAGFTFVILVVHTVVQLVTAAVIGVMITIAHGASSPLDLAEIIAGFQGLIVSFTVILAAVIGGIILLVVTAVRRGVTVSGYLGLKRVRAKHVLISLAAVVLLIVLSDAVSVLLGHPVNTQDMVDMYNTSIWPVLLWFAMIVFAPVFEEALFRGFIFAGLKSSKLGIVGTILVTSLVWTALHIQYGAYELVVIFVSGLLLGYARYKTGSLWTPLVMHAFMNIIATLQVALNFNSLFG